MSKQGRTIELAWARWRMRVPPDWRPLDVQGDGRKGTMMLGDANSAVMQVKWQRPSRRFRPERWLRGRIRRIAGRRGRPEEMPSPEGFAPAAFAVGGKADDAPRRVWYGYAPRANLAMELVINKAAAKRQLKSIDRRVLPSLSASGDDEECRWALFDAGFVVPAGYRYRASRLHLGEIALCFAAPNGGRLLVRQVYPSGLALSRGPLPKWLDNAPFKERRRFRATAEDRPWQVASFGRKLKGVIREGRKRLPVPLGLLAPRWSIAAAAEDGDLERLLMAEVDDPSEERPDLLAEVVAKMNYARFAAET